MLVVDQLNLTLNHQPILKNISLCAPANTTICVIGQSGAGKTSLLRCLAGLESCQSYHGSIRLNERVLDGVAPQQRHIGYVEQHPTLFPHFTIGENIAYPLHLRHQNKTIIAERVNHLLERCQLTQCAHRYPHEVSGGELRRAMLARSLIYEPAMLLLDEPFSAVDALRRVELAHWLKQLLTERSMTAVYVTHDIPEARFMSERALVLHQGQQLAFGTWEELNHHSHPVIHDLLNKHF